MYNSLILPYFDYCSTIWGISADCNMNRLQKLQNRFARMVLQVDIRTPHKLMLSQLRWQSINQRIDYQYYLYTFKIINDLVPTYLQPLLHYRDKPFVTRNNYPLYIKTPRTEYYNRSFHVYASKLWNQLSTDIQTMHNLDIFKKKCKLFTLKNCNTI